MSWEEDNAPPEEEPEALRKKWEAEDVTPLPQKTCRHCGQPVEGDSFFCLFCGERVFEESGPIGKLAHLIKSGKFISLVLVVLLAVLFLSLF